MRRLIRAALTAVFAMSAVAAEAACQIDVKPVAFGIIDVGQRSDSTGEIAVSCAIATSFSVAINGVGAPDDRFMTGPGSGRLAYGLFTDATFSTLWGDGSGAGQVVTGMNDGETISRLTVYGRVPQQNAVPAGLYSDFLTVELNFQ